MSSDLTMLDACAQAELVRRGETTPSELVEAAIERIERLNPKLNAVITPLFEQARGRAGSPDLPGGPLRGAPFLLKDLVCTSAGDPYHAGMRFLRDLGVAAPADTELARRFRAAGLVTLGKTNTPEIGSLPSTEGEAYGPTRNPWDPSRSPGGSSGGSAAAVASGMVPVAHANDGGGSIRIPASACGVVGLKPSRGRVSLGPEIGESWAGMTAELVVTRSVRDTAAVLDAVHGMMPGDPYTAPPPQRPYAEEVGREPGALRIGLLARAPGNRVAVHPECAEAARRTALRLEALGHRVEEAHPEALDDEVLAHATFHVIATGVAKELATVSRLTGKPIGAGDVEPHNWTLAELGRAIAAPDYASAVDQIRALGYRMARFWAGGFDLLVTPTLPEPPLTLGQFAPRAGDPSRGLARAAETVAFTAPFNATGQPAVSLPLHWTDDGLPIGVQLVAAYGREDALLRAAGQLERAHPWADRLPPIHASR